MSVEIDVKVVIPPSKHGLTYLVEGLFDYYHYRCDGVNDEGWGCGYRTLQSICSWINHNIERHNYVEIPSIEIIQKTLVKLEDKPKSFFNSREWIGSVEVGLVIDDLYDIPCKILHIDSGKHLKDHIDTIRQHFINNHCPIMMGGNIDCSSKSIIGLHCNDKDSYFLIMDPHCRRNVKSQFLLENEGWIKWFKTNDFIDDSFYNLCMPQMKMCKK